MDYTFFALLLRDCNAVRNEQIVIIADILISQEFLWDAKYFGYDWNLSVLTTTLRGKHTFKGDM